MTLFDFLAAAGAIAKVVCFVMALVWFCAFCLAAIITRRTG